MKNRKSRIMIVNGKLVTPRNRPALTVMGVVVTPTDHTAIWNSIRNGDKD